MSYRDESMPGPDFKLPNPNEILESAMDKLNRADRLETTAVLTFEESRAILQKLEMLQDTIEEYHYEKSTRD